MPVDMGNGVTPGTICESCIHLRPMEGVSPCPHGNSQWPDKKTFFVGSDGTPGSKCYDYVTYDDLGVEASSRGITKDAQKMKDSELNVAIYQKIQAMSEKDQKSFFKYWNILFPKEYAKEMTTDKVETGPKNKNKKDKKDKKEPNKFEDGFKK